jgi:peroxiredoxin
MKKIIVSLALTFAVALVANAESPKKKIKALKVGDAAPAFKIKDTNGKEIDLAKLTIKGPVLVRLTCGCLGCDRELPYFQALHKAYQKEGIRLVAVFAEPDKKFAKYVKTKKLNMLYATDPKRTSWSVFGTKTMPSNFLIGKGGKVVAISKGCDPSGLIARNLGDKTATLVKAEKVDIKKQVDQKKKLTPKK